MVILTSSVDGNIHMECFDDLEVSSFLLMRTHFTITLKEVILDTLKGTSSVG